jgi:hypothetical protein
MRILTASDQSTDADDGMINLLGKLISHCLADFIIRFAVVTVGSRKTPKVRHRLNIPHDDVGWHFRYSGLDEQITRDPCRSSISAGRNSETDTSKAARATMMLPARANSS